MFQHGPMVIALPRNFDGDAMPNILAALGAAILDIFRTGGSETVSFAGLGTATSSFVNAAFVELLAQMTLDELKACIKITDSTRQINDMIKHCLTTVANRSDLVA